jgi:hypothetical protein
MRGFRNLHITPQVSPQSIAVTYSL